MLEVKEVLKSNGIQWRRLPRKTILKWAEAYLAEHRAELLAQAHRNPIVAQTKTNATAKGR